MPRSSSSTNNLGLCCYTWDGCAPQEFDIHIKGDVKELRRLGDGQRQRPLERFSLEPVCVRKINPYSEEKETLFHVRLQPGDFIFFEIK